MSRLIRPTPRPTKLVITNSRSRGCPVIAPTKELTQPMAAVTREVTEEIISAMKTPPYRRVRRLIRPTPRPTKPTITNIRIRGLSVMAPTKEPIQETEPATREPMSLMIAAREPTAGVGDVKTPHFKNIYNRIIDLITRIATKRKAKPTK